MTIQSSEPGLEWLPRLVIVARHGKSVLNAEHRISGQADAALCREGLAQARRLDEALSTVPLTAIYTSTLERTLVTALPVARRHGLPIRGLEALREQNFGVLEGRFRDARDPEAHALWCVRRADPLGFRAPGGESYAELESRVRACLNTTLARHPGGTVLIVGHRNTNRVVLATLLGLDREQAMRTRPSHKWVYEIMPGEPPVVHSRSLRAADLGVCKNGLVM